MGGGIAVLAAGSSALRGHDVLSEPAPIVISGHRRSLEGWLFGRIEKSPYRGA
ncbi:MAG TPA: hypothetical protein VIZ22_06415 [Candidatus Limnocylindrales bacterium]